ncbi:MAG TPA: sulfatase-like hydrolase/transferase [Limnochordia bacterium]
MSRSPNILLILADDFGYGDLGAFGNPHVSTPHLDALAAQSLRPRQHYSAAPVCAPARAGLLTGRYPHRTGAIDTLETRGSDRLALSEVTLADLLRDHGYATGLFGKWHLGAFDPRFHPNRRGFDVFVGFSGGWSDYFHYRLDRNGSISPGDGRYLTDVITEEACAFIRQHRQQPFFAHVTYNAPHFPFQAPEADIVPFREQQRFTETVCTIYAMNKRMDEGVGRLLETLDECGLRDGTVVIFTSDNGPQLGGDAARFNGPWRGSKAHVFEGGIRTPCLIRWPDGLPGDRDDSAMVTFLDYLPTLLHIAGIPRPNLALDGIDMLPAWRGERAHAPPTRFWQWTRYRPHPCRNAAMRDGPWKLVRGAIPRPGALVPGDGERDRKSKYAADPTPLLSFGPPDGEPDYGEPSAAMLFHLDEDPGETRDLAALEPARVARMEAALDAWFADVNADQGRDGA